MTPFRVTLALVLVMVVVLLAAGCNGGTSPVPGDSAGIPTSATPDNSLSLPRNPVVCPPMEHREYRVVQGESFTYRGISPGYGGQSVNVAIYSEQVPPFPQSEPVDGNGSFSIFVDKDRTKQDWENHGYNYSGRTTSPYDHICMQYSTGIDCFDLLIVQNKTDLNTTIINNWIRVGPFPDQVIPIILRNNYTGNFFVNGTTSLPMGEQLNITMMSLCIQPCPKTPAPGRIGCCGAENYESSVVVREGYCGINTWSLLVNTTPNLIGMTTVNGVFGDFNIFLVSVSGRNRITNDNLWDAATFVVRVREEMP
jgi:hypothetical protein